MGLYTYPVFRPSHVDVFGGSEIRSYLFMRQLAAKGYRITNLVMTDKGVQPGMIDGVEIRTHPAYKSRRGMRKPHLPFRFKNLRKIPLHDYSSRFKARWQRLTAELRYQLDKLTGNALSSYNRHIYRYLVQIYKEVDADVYCISCVTETANCVTETANELLAFCKHSGKTFVLFIGSDIDLSESYRYGNKERNPYGSSAEICRNVLDGADLIISQTDLQKNLARERFNLNTFTVLNPVDLSTRVAAEKPTRPKVLWVGKSDYVKNPLMLIDLAKKNPDISFQLIMNKSREELHNRVLDGLPNNVAYIENVPVTEIESYFASATLFVNTSEFEGFPNTFLQAGKYGIPILTFKVDPNRLISAHGCGLCANGEPDNLVRCLHLLIHNRDIYRKCADNIRRYVEEFHSLEKNTAELLKIFENKLLPKQCVA